MEAYKHPEKFAQGVPPEVTSKEHLIWVFSKQLDQRCIQSGFLLRSLHTSCHQGLLLQSRATAKDHCCSRHWVRLKSVRMGTIWKGSKFLYVSLVGWVFILRFRVATCLCFLVLCYTTHVSICQTRPSGTYRPPSWTPVAVTPAPPELPAKNSRAEKRQPVHTCERYPMIPKTLKVEKAKGNLKCWMVSRVNRGFDSWSCVHSNPFHDRGPAAKV